MDFLFLAVAVLGISMQLVFTKMYQKKAGSSVFHTLFFNAATALFSLVLFLFLSAFRIRFTAFSVVMAALLAVIFSANGLLAIKICSMGDVAVYTLFLMLGGMALPFVYGVAFLGEKASVFRCAALFVLIAALVFQCLDSGKGKVKGKKSFFVFCFLIFLSNGSASVVSKMHQDPAWLIGLGASAESVGTNEFLVLTYFFMAVVNGAAFVVYLVSENRRSGKKTVELSAGKAGENAGGIGEGRKIGRFLPIVFTEAAFSSVGYLMQLLGARNLDASLLYPIVTGGTIVFGSIFGAAIFKEKIRPYGILSIASAFVATVLFAF